MSSTLENTIATMSRKILIVGAGKSTSYLIDYFLEKSTTENLQLTIGDINPDAIPAHIGNHRILHDYTA